MSQITKHIELKFWDIVIPLLSNSTWLRGTMNKLSELYHDENIVKNAATGVIIAFAGFAFGFLVFSLSTIFS